MRLRLCRPSEFLVAQLCEQGDQWDQQVTTQSAAQARLQATSEGGGSPSQEAVGTTSPEKKELEIQLIKTRTTIYLFVHGHAAISYKCMEMEHRLVTLVTSQP